MSKSTVRCDKRSNLNKIIYLLKPIWKKIANPISIIKKFYILSMIQVKIHRINFCLTKIKRNYISCRYKCICSAEIYDFSSQFLIKSKIINKIN